MQKLPEVGQKYWTAFPQNAVDWDVESEDGVLIEYTDTQLVREWICGAEPVFDELVVKRCKVFLTLEEAAVDARATMEDKEARLL